MLARSESKWSLKCNMMNLEENEVGHQQMKSTWCGVQGGQGECWCWWRSSECNWGEQSWAKEGPRWLKSVHSVEQPSMLGITKWGGMLRVWNEIEELRIEVGEWIEERWQGLRRAYSSVGVPVGRGGGGRDIQSLEWNRGAPNRGRRGDWGASFLA